MVHKNEKTKFISFRLHFEITRILGSFKECLNRHIRKSYKKMIAATSANGNGTTYPRIYEAEARGLSYITRVSMIKFTLQ